MNFNYFLIILLIFLIIYFILRKLNILKDSTEYSSHKLLGSENKSPIILGGLYILIIVLIFHTSVSLNISIALGFIVILGLLSDKNILPNPKLRLLFQLLILSILVHLNNLQINDLRNEYLNLFLSYNFFNTFFTVICLAILLNGSNFLDGLNGLISGYYLMVIISLLSLNYLNSNSFDFDYNLLTILFYALLIFFIFNVFGLVYLGDGGSYAISLLIGTFLIKLYSVNNLISPYYIAAILWYPAFENLFSLLRRIIRKKKVSNADNHHLHQLLFLFLKSKKIFSSKTLNSSSSIIILLINTPSFLISNLFPTKTIILVSIITINICIYLLAYNFFFKQLKN